MRITPEKPKIFNASRFQVGVVVSRFNQEITGKILAAALETLKEYKVKDKNVKVVSVPGSVEIPLVLRKFARTKRYDCLVAIGAVIKGETDHYTYVCKMAQEGALRVMLDYGIPVGFGVLTVSNPEQAKARINIGGAASAAALELANLKLK
jgi:6,7-dimethyl-8-ribityllumazine synthase